MGLAKIVTLPNKPTHYMENESIILYKLKEKQLAQEHTYTKGKKKWKLWRKFKLFSTKNQFLTKRSKLDLYELFSLKA